MDLELYQKNSSWLGFVQKNISWLVEKTVSSFFPEKYENMTHVKGQGFFIMTK